MATTSPAAPADLAKSSLLTPYRVVAGLLALLVLAQAVIAGQSENLGYGDWSITPHGVLGNVSFLLGLASVGLAYAIGGDARRRLLPAAAVLAVLLTSQIGMGYAAEENRDLGGIHISLGVVIFGLAIYQVALVRRLATADR